MMLSTSMAYAEGYQVNLQSTKQAGMAHVGTAMKLGAESMHFNPAALVFMDKTIDLSVGGSAVISEAKYDDHLGYKAKTNNSISTPLYAYAGFSIYKNTLAAGISVTTPYGSSLEWGKHWKGATAVQDISLRSFVFQPTMSVQIVEGLSFGAGLMIATGNFELSRSMMSVDNMINIMNSVQPGSGAALDKFKGLSAASATLSGNSNIRLGYNLGLMYQINPQITVGLTYRSKIKMIVDAGDAEMTYLNDAIESILTNIPTFPLLNNGTFGAELPLPSNTTLGISYAPADRWMVAFDIQYTGWKAYDKLEVKFTEQVIESGRNITSIKDYKNSFAYRLGAQYRVTDRLDVRAGVYYDETPVRASIYNPETPGSDKVGLCAGFTFKPYENLCIDVAFTYVDGAKREGSYTNPLDVRDIIKGEYKTTAFIPSFGVSYKF